MRSIFHYCRGESHKATDKPCQDCAYAESSSGLSLAVVSDGHGGERYFRSDRGSKLLVDITVKAIKKFVEEVSENVFANAEFTCFPCTNAELPSAHKALMWLFSSIICQWNNAIVQDAMEYDLTEWEKKHVEEKYLKEFETKRGDVNATFEKTYGCTLMVYVQTAKYWLAFHIGDGKAVFLQNHSMAVECEQLIPWDEKCFLNKTTSICDSDALNEFRYCYEGNGHFPIAVFLGSDGMDDTYGDGEKLHNFYINLYKQVKRSGEDMVKRMLRSSMPEISRLGSKDDMSIACVYDDIALKENFVRLTRYQMEQTNIVRGELQAKETDLERKIAVLSSCGDPNSRINLQYAEKELLKVKTQIRKLGKQYSELKKDLNK